nr:MAG TPA: hypothetical protein [Caudoviricetes sp.]
MRLRMVDELNRLGARLNKHENKLATIKFCGLF